MIVIGSRNDALLQQRGKAMAIEMAADQVVASSMNLVFRMSSSVSQNRLLCQRYYVNKLDPYASLLALNFPKPIQEEKCKRQFANGRFGRRLFFFHS